MTKELTQKTGVFAGVSSGSVVRAAQRTAEKMESGKIVCLLADGGWKYLSTGLWNTEYEEIASRSRKSTGGRGPSASHLVR